jgi:AcrR family transcriptional regulator
LTREDQKLRSDAVRQAILDTALEIGLNEGFEAVSIRKIIGKMNYSTGVIYHYFKDKQEIIDAIEEAETAWLGGEIRRLITEDMDAVTNMKTAFRRSMQLALEEPEKYNLIVLHKYSRKNPSSNPWLSYLAGSLQRDMEAGRIRKMDPQKAAIAIWSSFLGFNLTISRQIGIAKDEAQALFDTQMDIVLKGILKNE